MKTLQEIVSSVEETISFYFVAPALNKKIE